MSTEDYIYLGQKGDFFIFANFSATKDRRGDLDADVYNAAVHCKLFENKEQRCIVFSVEEDEKVSITLVDNLESENPASRIVFAEGRTWKDLFADCVDIQRDHKLLLLRFDHKMGAFLHYEIDPDSVKFPSRDFCLSLTFKDPLQYMSRKKVLTNSNQN